LDELFIIQHRETLLVQTQNNSMRVLYTIQAYRHVLITLPMGGILLVFATKMDLPCTRAHLTYYTFSISIISLLDALDTFYILEDQSDLMVINVLQCPKHV
jgi:hypothetical protein